MSPLVAPTPVVPAADLGRVHLIGVGGVSMSGIARLLAGRGLDVTGCDREESAALASVRAAGVATVVGHDPAHVADRDTVIFNSARTPLNAAELAAAEVSCRLLHRSAALASLMAGRRVVAVSGSHGKTTATGMIIDALASLDPGYMVGSTLATSGRGASDGTGDWFVTEADESDGSFLQYDAEIAVVTNIEADHLDNWGTPAAYAAGFARFCRGEAVRTVVASADDPGAAELVAGLRADGRRVVTVGFDPGADVALSDPSEGVAAAATLRYGADTGRLELRVPGRYNLANAAAAYAVARLVGLGHAEVLAGLGRFAGTARRFQPVGKAAGVRVIDDYAHHPTEVAATLTAARGFAGAGRVVVAFQPHLYTRTRDFAAEFGAALRAADEVVVADVYPAREEPIPGVTGRLVSDAVGPRARFVADLADVPAALAEVARPGDTVLTVGAGTITRVGPQLLALLGERG